MTVTDMFRLDGKVAVVTGASSGLGVAFARALAEAGADVALRARRLERLEDTRELAAALLFLASDAGVYVTGQTLAVDGVLTIT